ncbi:hypothetical protein J2Y69_001383 [Microbacterium resistens]|uniref:DUF732 domain-containing protein n=1 Tax=Microbacterium resistens TaxID=156977 RepID=A0ABU1SB14_9MICO|nr:hypothetical protein [Microbacterium resistens]MDR6866784.1 hypothetical protein [Microbacterium resistens]
MRVSLAGLLIALAVLMTGCSTTPFGQDPAARIAGTVAALKDAVGDSVDDGTAQLLDENGVFEQLALDLVSLCDGEEAAGMGLIFFANYGMDDAILAGWEAACPGKDFPG